MKHSLETQSFCLRELWISDVAGSFSYLLHPTSANCLPEEGPIYWGVLTPFFILNLTLDTTSIPG